MLGAHEKSPGARALGKPSAQPVAEVRKTKLAACRVPQRPVCLNKTNLVGFEPV
ncbi:hypothetical protein AWB75_05116 [Caballeronia catudaia]|uniref:Uncharacterized protein n=1 Tax=Caballeronia catudaia TaxID=1777136 RepID=A0A158CGR8_9BURK|nr:hypothetical protein AWB75_05116 [Caballeronia catudaia]